jgi:LmbE family N-acetylglucosaminyl deacetylase
MPDRSVPRRVVAIAAHPDDLDFGCAGTLALWASKGAEVHELLVTSGDKGFEDERPLEEKQAIREREQRAAAREIGAAEAHFLRFPDGEVENDADLRRAIVRVLRRVRPDTVLTFDPANLAFDNFYRYHPDHRAVASAALDAVFPSSETSAIFPELLAEGLGPHKVKQVFIAGSLDPDVFVDIGATLRTKCRALKAHRSQVGKGEWVDQLLGSWALRDGTRGGLRHAEAFKRMVLG